MAAVSSMSSSAGTLFHTVTRQVWINSAQACGSRRCDSSMHTIAAPAVSAPNRSYTDRSKSNADTASIRSSAPTWNRALMSTMVFNAARWAISTPFGVPVDPDVKITYAESKPSLCTGSANGCAVNAAVRPPGVMAVRQPAVETIVSRRRAR